MPPSSYAHAEAWLAASLSPPVTEVHVPTASSTTTSSAPSAPCGQPRASSMPATRRATTSAAESSYSRAGEQNALLATLSPQPCVTWPGSGSPYQRPRGSWMWCRTPCGRLGAPAKAPLSQVAQPSPSAPGSARAETPACNPLPERPPVPLS